MKIIIQNHLDATYLKKAKQAAISEKETLEKVRNLVQECIDNKFVLAMIRPKFVKTARKMITDANSNVLVGTVIGFHKGTASIKKKLKQAQKAMDHGADELDYVINYKAFKKGNTALVAGEVLAGTKIVLDNNKKVKWIIEIAALSDKQIADITALIRDVVLKNFNKNQYADVFVKSSTGFYKRTDGGPVGATFEAMQIIKDKAGPLSIKAAGGVRNYQDAIKMIQLGVSRIGTSSAKKIADGENVNTGY